MKKILVGVFCLMLSACADSHMVSPVGSAERLSGASTAYILIPTDGRYGQTIYGGSGQTTAQAVAGAFARYVDRVEVAMHVEQFDEAQERAQAIGADYIIVPQILHWEDRATEWSAIPDRVEVRLTVREIASGRTLASAVISGKSGLATFGGDHPQDLLADPLNEYVATLF